jgi:DNA-binding NarL/FixJ family response regulator
MTRKEPERHSAGRAENDRRARSARRQIAKYVTVPQVADKSPDTPRVGVAIATQSPLFRYVLSLCFAGEDAMEVVGEARDEAGIIEILKTRTPDLILFDSETLGPASEGMITRLSRIAPEIRILLIAMRLTDENVEKVLRADACGLVGKQLGYETPLRAVRAVAAGEIWANRRAQALTLEHLTDPGAGAPDPEAQLTKRERQIVDGVARGLRNKEIARELNISEKTVKSHLNSVFQKLGLEGRFALAVIDQAHPQPRS